MDGPRPDDDEVDRPGAGTPDDPTAPIPELPRPADTSAGAATEDLTHFFPRVVPAAPSSTPFAPAGATTPATEGGTGTVGARPSVSRRRRIGATIGIVVCAILIVVAVLGRFYAVGKVDELAGRVDQGLQRGVTLVETTSGRVQPVADAASTVVDAAEAAAASPSGPIGTIVGVLGDVTGLGERYRQFRTTYDEARQVVLGAFERLHTIDALIPQIEIPTGPEEAFRALDERILSLDQAFTDLDAASPLGDFTSDTASKIAEKAQVVESAVGGIASALDDAKTRLQQARTDVQSLAGTINLAITLLIVVIILGFLYIAFLNWLLLHP
jgi:hypothetical protein